MAAFNSITSHADNCIAATETPQVSKLQVSTASVILILPRVVGCRRVPAQLTQTFPVIKNVRIVSYVKGTLMCPVLCVVLNGEYVRFDFFY